MYFGGKEASQKLSAWVEKHKINENISIYRSPEVTCSIAKFSEVKNSDNPQ